jgi:hypothetical protein
MSFGEMVEFEEKQDLSLSCSPQFIPGNHLRGDCGEDIDGHDGD